MSKKSGNLLGGCTAEKCLMETPETIHLCKSHSARLCNLLREVPGTWADILTSARKLDVGAGSVGGGGGKASSQEPANLDALDKARTLEVVLRGWASHLGQAVGEVPAVAAWLYVRRGIIRQQEWAGDFLQELRDSLNDCNRATDRAGQRVFAGMCPTEDDGNVCGQPLYALTGRPTARCRQCKQEWDVSDWRERALEAAELQHGTASQISRMLSDPVTREALPQATIRSWANRGKLEAVWCQVSDRRNVYRVSDVRTLWAATKAASYRRTQLAA